MKKILWSLFFVILAVCAFGQTRIAKEQIEDAFLLNEGGAVYGDINLATSTLRAQQFHMQCDPLLFQLFCDGDHAIIRSDADLYLDPSNNGVAGAVIVPCTVVEFPDFLGDKIRLYDTAYKIGVSAFNLDFTSDRNFRFHSDTVVDLMVIAGDDGDVSVRHELVTGGDIRSGGAYRFASDSVGDKLFLWGDIYKVAISGGTVDFYTDQYFKWHSDEVSNAMTLNADSGRLSLSGALQLKVVASLPSGNVGDVIYLDHPTDDTQDGAYVYTSAGWQSL